MVWIEWSQEYSVNIKKIDEQHKKLINVINKLYDGLSGDSKETFLSPAKEIINNAIAELTDYTKYHFSEEEALMRNLSYPDYLSHKAKHDDFVLKVIEFQDSYRKGHILVLSVEIIRFLRDWLLNHILTIDKQYSPFFNRQGMY